MNLLDKLWRRRCERARSGEPHRRRGRSFATSFGSLEPRALLATVSPVPLALTSVTAVVSLPGLAPPGTDPTSIDTRDPGVPFPHPPRGLAAIGIGGGARPADNGNDPVGPDFGGGGGQAPADPVPVPAPYREKNHVALAEAAISIDGVKTQEFALADAGISKVFVRNGPGQAFAVFGPSDGVDHPQSVVLHDVNGDGIPDLIVANSGANNVLVFPGLPGGLFGPEINGGNGFSVGQNPVSVTVGELNKNGITDLIVANKDSDSVSILQGQGSGPSWTASLESTINVAATSGTTAPVKTALVDVNQDGHPVLFVCNSASNNVYLYPAGPNGTFNTANPTVFDVGINPSEMLVGRFDKNPRLDLITVNSGSNNLTFVGGVLTAHPTVQTYSSGGLFPDAAIAVDLNHNGVMGLVVANSGDGRVSLFQGTNEGMQLAGVITQANIPVPTSLASASWSSGGLDLFAASAGQDAAQLLHFDLGTLSIFLSSPLSDSGSASGAVNELIAGLMPFGESELELIAVFWTGRLESVPVSGAWELRGPSIITALYSPTEGQGTTEPSAAQKDVGGNPALPFGFRPVDPSKVDTTVWARFVLGIDLALGQPRGIIEAVAARDVGDIADEHSDNDLVRLDRQPGFERPLGLDVEGASDTVDEALRQFWSEGPVDEETPPAEQQVPGFDPVRVLDGIDAATLEGHLETVPQISSAVLISMRLILKASPPRPTSAFGERNNRKRFSDLGDARPIVGRPGRN